MPSWPQSGPGWNVVAQIANQRIVVVSEPLKLDMAVYKSIEAICPPVSARPCNIAVWSNSLDAPRKFPVTEKQSDAQVALFMQSDGFWIWNCRINTNVKSKSQCFAGTTSSK